MATLLLIFNNKTLAAEQDRVYSTVFKTYLIEYVLLLLLPLPPMHTIDYTILYNTILSLFYKKKTRNLQKQPFGAQCEPPRGPAKAVQSPPFQAAFRHLTGGAKRAKEAPKQGLPREHERYSPLKSGLGSMV